MAFADIFSPPPKRRKRKGQSAAAPVSQDVDIVLDGVAEGPTVNPDTGVAVQINDDGSADIDFSGNAFDDGDEDEGDTSHTQNLADKIDEMEQGRIAELLLDAIEADKQDRQQWVTMRAKLVELLGMKLDDPKSDVSGSTMGMSTSVVRDPILNEAVERGRANAFAEMCPAAGPVKVVNWDEGTPGTDELATELEKDLNYYLTTTASEYYPDTRYMLWWTYLASGTFKKVYMCPLRRRPVSEYVAGTDLIVPTNATDLKNAGRITHEVQMRRSVLKRMQIAKVYKNIDLGDPMPQQTNAVDQKVANIEGRKAQPQRPEDEDYTIYECYCELDIDGFEHKDDGKPSGLPLPYRVTLEADSRKILEIRRNWDEEDEDYIANIPFILFPFSTGLSRIYGSGLGHMGGNIAAALTALLRIAIDGGMAANYPGLIKAKGTGRQINNEIAVPPGGCMEIDTGGLPIQQTVMGMPYKDASAALIPLMENIRTSGQRLLGSADLPVGEGNQDAQVGTILATIEQAVKVLSGVHKALHAAQSEEFRQLVRLFKDEPEALWRGNRRPAMGTDKAARLQKFKQAVENSEIVPQADPNVPSEMHRKLLALGFKQLTMGNPAYDPVKVDKYVAKMAYKMGDQEFDSFLAPPQQAPPDPRLVAAQANMQAKALAEQTKLQVAAMQQKSKDNDAQLKAQDSAIRGHVDLLKLQNAAADRESQENLAMVNTAKEIIQATSVHPETEGAVDDQLKQWLPFMQPQHTQELPPQPQMADGGSVMGSSNLDAAMRDLKLSPEERALYERHLTNLYGPGGVDNPDGSRSTLYQAVIGQDGRYYSIPTVWGGKILPPREAAQRAASEGMHNFPSYGSPEEADARYSKLHDFMEKDTAQAQRYLQRDDHDWEDLVHPVTQQPLSPVGGMQ